MSNLDFKDKIGNKVIDRCQDALKRIREGISIIENDDTSFEAFCFMNRVIFLQNSIKGYAKKHGTGTEFNIGISRNASTMAGSKAGLADRMSRAWPMGIPCL